MMITSVIALQMLVALMFSQQLQPRVVSQTLAAGLQVPELSDADYQKIATGIFNNETGGQYEKLAYWGQGEDFPSFGIGHFIWFPYNVDAPFDEQFPAMVGFVRKAAGDRFPLPDWLHVLQPLDAPWTSKQQFDADLSSSELAELRQWLWDTRHYQARFVVSAFKERWEQLQLDNDQRADYNHLLQTLMKTSDGLFAVMDYYNFKGLGNNPRERYQEQGWGLLQVLQEMLKLQDKAVTNKDYLQNFSTAAANRLKLRVSLAPAKRQESRWLPGWLKRLSQYTPN
jgi:hypothetical protein